jgi:hypothetical protein
MARSVELDLYPSNHPELAELIEGSIGADSMFHQQFGYYADAVGPETARLPPDWMTRAVRVDVGRVLAICPEIHDLAVSKLLAARDKDIEWLREGLARSLIDRPRLKALLGGLDLPIEERRLAEARAERLGTVEDD